VADERSGPLSYEIPDEVGEVSAQRPILLAGGLALVLGPVAFGLGWLAMGVLSSERLVLALATLLIVGPPLVLAWSTTRGGFRRRRRNALVAAGGVGLFVALIAGQLLELGRPTFPQLEATFDGIRLGDEVVVVSESRSGSRNCKGGPPAITRVLRAPAVAPPSTPFQPSRQSRVTLMVQSLLDQGWEPGQLGVPVEAQSSAVKGEILADIFRTESDAEIRVILTSKSSC
jgi:hypothetical protein